MPLLLLGLPLTYESRRRLQQAKLTICFHVDIEDRHTRSRAQYRPQRRCRLELGVLLEGLAAILSISAEGCVDWPSQHNAYLVLGRNFVRRAENLICEAGVVGRMLVDNKRTPVVHCSAEEVFRI